MNVTEKRWYLIYTKARQEALAKENLERQGYKAWLPLARELKKRNQRLVPFIGPLFPRYLFINLDKKTDNWAPIRSTLGVSTVVRFGLEPIAVPEDLVKEIQAREDKKGLIELIPENYKPGRAIRVVAGGLEGVEGIFLSRNREGRVTVLLNILGKTTRTALPRGYIEPLS